MLTLSRKVDECTPLVTGGGRGNPDISNLGRKWNVCVVGSSDFFEHPDINDLAFIPAMRGGAMGFNILVGGFISSLRAAESVALVGAGEFTNGNPQQLVSAFPLRTPQISAISAAQSANITANPPEKSPIIRPTPPKSGGNPPN